MSRLKIITKYFVKNALEQGLGGKKKMSWITVSLLTILIMACFSAPFITVVLSSYDFFASINQEGYLLSFILLAGSMVILFFGIFSILNTFYFANDIEQILPLPFKSSEVIFGKFITVLIEMYMYALMIVFPMIAYGVVSKAGIIFYIYLLLVFILMPVVPMAIGVIICMLLMRFSNLSKHKDAFTMISGVLMLVLIIGFNVYSQNSGGGLDSAETIQNLMQQGNNSLMDVMGNVFFTSTLSAKALLYSAEAKGLQYLAIALVISLCLFALLFIVGGNIYYKSIMGISETYSKRENVFETKKVNKTVKSSSPVKAFIMKDLKIMFRTPQFFINCIAMMIYMPAIFGIAFFSGNKIDMLSEFMRDSANYGYIIAVIFGFSILCVCGGGAALTAISREGRDFMVSKYIPVPIKDQIKAKVILSVAINELAALVIIVALALLNTSLILLIMSGIISILSVGLVAIIELFLDYRSPKLEWDTEKDIFKKNFLPLILMFAAFALAGLLALISFLLNNYIIVFLIASIIMAVLIAVFYPKVNKAAYRLYEAD